MTGAHPLLRHLLATAAYRTQKALRGAPPGFGDFQAAAGARTPRELVHHMSTVLAWAVAALRGEAPAPPEPATDLGSEVERFHVTLQRLADLFQGGLPKRDDTAARLLQGPLADVLTHVGQLALLRRLAGAPVPGESFFAAEIDAENVGPDQPLPAEPLR
ncbi:MAG TPA: hypothetical protein VHG91_14190 [Longimicrobium sp.]|nr:hypothetical protein [Longimicrobium sp.]